VRSPHFPDPRYDDKALKDVEERYLATCFAAPRRRPTTVFPSQDNGTVRRRVRVA
jgi:hypothetical protein